MRPDDDWGKRVLVVDDDEDFRESLKDILAGAGYDAAGAASAAEARSSMSRASADVLLVDMRLGHDDGAELVAGMRRDWPGSIFVTMTAYAGQEAVIRALRAGAYDYLVKPIESVDLFATLDRCFERVELERGGEQARAALRESEERYREVFENTSDGVYVVAVDGDGDFRIVEANTALERITGVKSTDAAGRPVSELLSERTASQVIDRYRAAVAGGASVDFSGEVDLPAGRKVLATTVIPVRDKEGTIRRLIGVVHDMTETQRMQEDLREREEFYREVFYNLSDGVFVVDLTPEGRYRLVSYNPAQERMVGITAAEAVGRYTEEYLPPDVARRVIADNDEVVAAGRTMTFDTELDLPAGHRWFQTTLVPVRTREGAVHRLIGVARDVTEKKQSEMALRLSEEKFSRIFHGSPDSIVISRVEDGRILEANPGFFEVYGYSRDEVIGRSSLPGDLSLYVDASDRERLLAMLRERGEVRGEEIAFRRKNGTIRWGLVAWRIIEIGGEERLLSITRDVTDRRMMEEALRDSEGRFRLLAENSTDMISRHTPEGIYLYASPACRALLGYEPEELVGKPAYEFFHRADLAAIQASHSTVMEGDVPYTVQYRIRRKDGSYTWFETVSHAVRDTATGSVLEIHAASRDISDRKRAEEREREHEQALFQASKLASLGTLVSGIAHEINNPNNYIRLNSQNLLEFWPDVKALLEKEDARSGGTALRGIPLADGLSVVENLLRGIEEGSKRIEKLVHNLRDFARGNEGSLNELVDVNAVVRSAVMIVQDLLRKSTDSFRVEETAALPPVRGNYHQIEQVVLNLLTNACQALPGREKGITVATKRLENGVAITITDEGTGIPEELIPRITDPFFTTRRGKGGSGLGLAVSSRIVQNHGGTMTFQSRVEQGTAVTVRLPAGTVSP